MNKSADTFSLNETTIQQIHAAMEAGTLTCRQLAAAYLERIAAYDQQGPCLNAMIAVNPQALSDAAELDRRFVEGGLTGPLHGIPVLLKDNIAAKGMATTGGSISLADFVLPEDAWITRRLKQAGALILGKTNLHEFAIWGETVSSIAGQTRNPYDLTRTPGGSSGGTGAAIAANFAATGIGTDTVNSIRSPASANALTGLRPTLGLVSRQGIIPYSLTQDTAGPITRTVTDAAILLEAIAGYDANDSITALSHGHIPPSYTASLVRDGLTNKRIGILRSCFGTAADNDAVNSIMAASCRLIREKGAILVELEHIIDMDEIVRDVSVHLYDLQADLDNFLTAANAPVTSLKEILASGRYHPQIGSVLQQAAALSPDKPDYFIRLARQAALREQLLQLLNDHQLDAFVNPHQQQLVVEIGEPQTERNGALAAVTGWPAITVPAGFSPPTEHAPLGVPVGIEFLGRPWSESLLLEIGYAFEQASLVRKPPASTMQGQE